MSQLRDLPWLDYGFDFNGCAGHVFANWTAADSWSSLKREAGYSQLMHVAAAALDYGFLVLEGFQVFRWKNNTFWAFRPKDHWQRLNAGATSDNLGLQEISWEFFLQGLKNLVEINSQWIPPHQASLNGAFFYVRPKLLGSSGQFRVRFPDQCLFSLCGSPEGPYWKTGFKPNKLLWWPEDPRSMPTVKWPGNYTPTGAARITAEAAGCSAPLFSFKDKATETHAASFGALIDGVFCYRADRHVLPGITLNSLVRLCVDEGIEARQTTLRQGDLAAAAEMMCVGTAAGIQPIDTLKRKVFRYNGQASIIDLPTPRVPKGQAGSFATKMSQRLWAIKTGQESDPHNWMVQVG